ncbi:hypothetical protein [Actinomadura hibisca]|uniref:hypothetical protein n=1 Tax=Actinomadura hibisca TaxID=68565 RepID=UPI0012F99CB6|nr:hypothetical protein [Actinomadura hibisca]
MTTAPPKHARGKHAKPSSGIATGWNRLIKNAALGEPGRRRLVAAGTGTASVALLAVAAVAGLSATDSRQAPRAETAARQAPSAPAVQQSAAPADDDPDGLPDALPYLEGKDEDKKTTGHVKEIRRSGDFVRIYTDLEEGDENSKPAVSLCEWTTQFLRDGGDEAPRVFVHGKSEGNGSVVLANKQSDKDDCEVSETR